MGDGLRLTHYGARPLATFLTSLLSWSYQALAFGFKGVMTTEVFKRINLPKLTYDEGEADYITGTSRQTRWRARQRGELKCVETVGKRVLYTLDMLLDWLNRRHYHRSNKRKR